MSSDEDYETYRQLLDLWSRENPIKTNKLQALLIANTLILAAVNISGGFRPEAWPLYLGGAVFSFIWVLSIGRTSLFQDVWQAKMRELSEKHPDDPRFRLLDSRAYIPNAPRLLRIAGGVPSKYYLIGAPLAFSLVWSVLFLYFFLTC